MSFALTGKSGWCEFMAIPFVFLDNNSTTRVLPEVVEAMQPIGYTKARNTLRISLSRNTTEQDIGSFIKVLSQILDTIITVRKQ